MVPGPQESHLGLVPGYHAGSTPLSARGLVGGAHQVILHVYGLPTKRWEVYGVQCAFECVCVHLSAYVCVHLSVCVCVCAFECMCVCMCVCMCMCVCI